MHDSTTNLLRQILTIINYSNKDKFIEEFEALNHLEALAHFTDKLPEELKQKKELEKEDIEKIKHYVSPQEYLKEVARISQKELHAFIEAVSPILTLAQKQKMTKLLHP